MTQGDPLGLTIQQRADGEFRTQIEDFMSKIRANLEFVDSLPDGTLIRTYPNGPFVPIESVR